MPIRKEESARKKRSAKKKGCQEPPVQSHDSLGQEGMHLRDDAPSLFSLIPFARTMRKRPTRSEAILWSQLRQRKVSGARFRRQHPLGGSYIVDFCAPCERLVVEVDGPIHLAQRHYDARRQRVLESLGYRVVRVSAELVERDVRAAVAIVRAALGPRAP
jgi:very-short-patch-repair endonuclease